MEHLFSAGTPLASLRLGIDDMDLVVGQGPAPAPSFAVAALILGRGRLAPEGGGRDLGAVAVILSGTGEGGGEARLRAGRGGASLLRLRFDPDPALLVAGAAREGRAWVPPPSPWKSGHRVLLPAPHDAGSLATLAEGMARELKEGGPGAELVAAAALAQLLAILSRCPAAAEEGCGLARRAKDEARRAGADPGRPLSIAEAVAWIDTHYDDVFTLDDMVSRCALNTSDFSRRFKAATGSPLFEYLNKRRIERACVLLRDGDLPVIDIALAVGYNSLSFFNRYFLRIMGRTPTAFRRGGR